MECKIQFIALYDLGKELTYKEIEKKLANIPQNALEEYDLEEEKGAPDYVSYPEPVIFQASPDFIWEEETHKVKGKIFRSGDLSFNVTLDLEIGNLAELNEFLLHNSSLKQEVKHHCNEIYRQISSEFLVDVTRNEHYKTGYSEIYPVYCITDTEFNDAEEFINNNENRVTALLTGKYREENFSNEEIENVKSNTVRFFNTDCSLIHWNGSLLIDERAEFSSIIFILELVNKQFLTLKLYDRYIDNYLSDFMESIDRLLKMKLLLHLPGLKNSISELTRIRVDIEKVTEMLDNYEKYFGKWYLARIYAQACEAFEINRWRELMESRLEKVTEFYSMMEEEINRNRMLFLNVLTLMLFILWFVIG